MRYQFLFGGQGSIDYINELIEQAENDPDNKAYDKVTDKEVTLESLKETLYILKKNKNQSKGGLNMGYDLDFLNEIYNQMVSFAGYAFNRSHSDSYADLGYITAFCKYYYPAFFWAAQLTTETKPEEMDGHYAAIKKAGIPLLPPDINKSDIGYTVEALPDGTYGIRLGITAIKGLGEKVAQAVIEGRPYASVEDYFNRVNKRAVNRSAADKLILAGAFDEINPNRYAVINEYHMLLDKQKDFTPYKEEVWDTKAALQYEKLYLGIYVSENPLGNLPYTSPDEIRDGETVDIGGQIIALKKIRTRKGDLMAFVKVQTQGEVFEFTIFPKEFAEFEDRLWEGGVMIFRAKKEIRDKISYIVEKVLYPKKSQLENIDVAERPDDLPKKDKKAAKKPKVTLEDMGGPVVKEEDDPLLALFV
jgi:DNA polymerase-3 subunit alpha